MARRVAALIRVELVDGVPRAFRHRGRRYGVRAVMAHWVEARPWWRDRGSNRGSRSGQTAIWRVEAASGSTAGVYDLRESAGRWRLLRVAD